MKHIPTRVLTSLRNCLKQHCTVHVVFMTQQSNSLFCSVAILGTRALGLSWALLSRFGALTPRPGVIFFHSNKQLGNPNCFLIVFGCQRTKRDKINQKTVFS
jgi:hypothetical protein